jgi:uncharacterized protein (DUF433 family)
MGGEAGGIDADLSVDIRETCGEPITGFRRGARSHGQVAEAADVRFWYAMDMDSLLSRITIDPAVCHGKPCVRGLRYPVENLLELLSSGMTFDEILADYGDLERDDLLAVLAFAARLARTRRLQPVVP